MNSRRSAILSLVGGLILLATSSPWAEYLLYTPQRVEAPTVPADPAEGVLVERVVIRKGDTLARISRKYIGTGRDFPQILLFNKIGNPDLIFAGATLLVPVTKRKVSTPKHVSGGKPVRQSIAGGPGSVAKPAGALESEERKLYDRGERAFGRGRYRMALELFSTFLKKFPGSPLAPEAALYRARCHERLAGL